MTADEKEDLPPDDQALLDAAEEELRQERLNAKLAEYEEKRAQEDR